MANQKPLLSKFLSFLLLSLSLSLWGHPPLVMAKEVIPVGVVLDLKSPVGRVAESYMSMALSDFYAVNDNYSTRLSLLTKDSGNDIIAAASAALDLIKNEEVQAIIGPQRSAQARFVIELCRISQVPIISFSATSPFLSPSQNPFFIRTTQDESAQVKTIVDIVKAFGWREIVPIYEDTEYGNGLIPYLMDALQEIDTRVPYRSVIPPSSNNTEISEELNKLKANHTRIFLVHMTASLGSKLFVLAKNAEMMSEGYAWIITQGLSSLLDPMGSKVMDSMQGVLGIRPYLLPSKKLKDFERKWKRNLTSIKTRSKTTTSLNLFGLWAYDTVWALAMAVEKAGIVHSSFLKQNASNSNVDLAALGILEIGTKLHNTILTTKFQGLSGNFHLVKGQLEPSAFELFNVIGRTERIIGYWTGNRGFSLDLNDTSEEAYSTSKDKLKQPIWPGYTTDQPTKLRIGVPIRNSFEEFLKVEWHSSTDDKPSISGFVIDVFHAVQDALPFPLSHEFIPYVNKHRQSNGTYDELLYQIKTQRYDAVVGDITIVANRSLYVDFTLPYSESGVSMVVLVKDDDNKNLWIFLRPLSLNLWLTTSVAFIFTGLVIWVLEHRVNTEFRGPPEQQLGLILWFSFSTLTFAHRERVVNNLSRFVLIIWMFLVLILTQSYTASLTSMLTVQRLQPTFVDVKEIKRKGYLVGYQKGSFIKGLLMKQLDFDESKLKPYETPEEYHEALSKGILNGGVAAAFGEIPYIKLFLAKYCSRYTMVGPTYKSDGFAFAFQQGSPLVPYISRAILNVTQDQEKIGPIERKYFSSQTMCEDQRTTISSHSPSLGVDSFGGLFLITGITSMVSLLVYVIKFFFSHWPTLSDKNTATSFCSKLVEMAKLFDQKDLSSHHFKREESRVHDAGSPDVFQPSPSIDDMQNHSRNSTEGTNDVIVHDDNRSLSSSSRHSDASMQDVPNSS
ncbi:glutamate receptor 2.8-like [Quercus lobata]|uniref:glutamate receptor 2.8-like n=1 Tax=Quercus lobata TaxID=97700 RepID=UPI0012459088|nr:glutamate receptor 2.8-like [Quercus lobata]